MPVNYDKHLDDALASLHEEGRYRVFTDLARRAGQFPRAIDYSTTPTAKSPFGVPMTIWALAKTKT